MNAERHAPDVDPVALLEVLRGRGVAFRLDGDKILYSPPELVAAADLEAIRECRPALVELLREHSDPAPAEPSPVVILRRDTRAGWKPTDPFCILPGCRLRYAPMTPTLRPGCYVCQGCGSSAVTINPSAQEIAAHWPGKGRTGP